MAISSILFFSSSQRTGVCSPVMLMVVLEVGRMIVLREDVDDGKNWMGLGVYMSWMGKPGNGFLHVSPVNEMTLGLMTIVGWRKT